MSDLIGKHCSFNLIVKRRNSNRWAFPSCPISVWQKHGEICLLLPSSYIDITVAMEVEIQPGPSTHIYHSTTSNNLYATSSQISALSSACINFSFPAKTTVNYSSQHLLDFKSRFPLSRSLSCLVLKDLRLVRTCCVSALAIVKRNSWHISVISGTRMIYSTHSLQEFAYYGDFNKRNMSYTSAASLLSAYSMSFGCMSGTQLHRYTKYRRCRAGCLVKSLERTYFYHCSTLRIIYRIL